MKRALSTIAALSFAMSANLSHAAVNPDQGYELFNYIGPAFTENYYKFNEYREANMYRGSSFVKHPDRQGKLFKDMVDLNTKPRTH
ncbi:hypothetical protein [Vibrio minamisatsumaniensis]|uniref:hypothetical protein n=1 Tax=Vibrio minamisatsumaniensis TaxID=2910243 RepID=UPI003D25BE56